MEYLFYSGILIAFSCIICLFLCRGIIDFLLLFGIALVNFFIRATLVWANLIFAFVGQKGAEGRVYQVIESAGWDGVLTSGSTFAVLAYLNAPGMFISGDTMPTLYLTNAFLGALAPVVAFAYLRKYFSIRAAWWGALLFSLYPAAVEFSITGLRDTAIFLFVTTYVFSLLPYILRVPNAKVLAQNALFMLTSLLCLMSLRPELLPILAIIPGMIVFGRIRRIFKRTKTPLDMSILAIVMAIMVLPMGFAGGAIMYKNTIANVGVHENVSPLTLIDDFSMRRFERAAGKEGGGSHILSTEEYQAASIQKRYLLQLTGMILVPLPWLLNSPAKFLALVDSFILMVCIWLTLRTVFESNRNRLGTFFKFSPHEKRTGLYLLLSFLVGIVLMAFVVTNAGNAFRMRLALVPFILIGAAMYLGVRKERMFRIHRISEPVDNI